MDAAYNLARWLTRNEHDAQDVAQEAFLRAFRFFGGFRGGNPRSWLLTIVRNTCFNWLEKNRSRELGTISDDQVDSIEDESARPENHLWQNCDRELVRQAIEDLPVEYREVVILRELEEMSYKEISDIAQVPMGTVMSRLARARKLLQDYLARHLAKGGAA
jgi:RNA polymerase sigma-70 factor (ECF subfamily)